MARRLSVRHPWRRRLFGLPPPNRLSRRLGDDMFDAGHRAVPAPLMLDDAEAALAERLVREPFVVMEPHVRREAAPGKRWPFERFVAVERRLRGEIAVDQVGAPDAPPMGGVRRLPTKRFRDAMPHLKAARLFIGPEGRLHAAAMATPAVVIFGGFTSPEVAGDGFHANLAGSPYASGQRDPGCEHCVAAMARIGVDDVLREARRLLGARPRVGR